MSTLTITPQLKVTMLKLLVSGRDLGFVALATQVPRETVVDVVSNHGYPDVTKMAWAVDVLLENTNKIPEQPAVNGHRPGVPLASPAQPANAQSTVHRPAPRPAGPGVNPPAMTRPVHASTAQLLHQASDSAHARTRSLGAKISALLADLTKRLAAEQEAHEAKVAAERDSAQKAARIAQLEAEIRKLKGKPAKTNTGVVSTHRESPADIGSIPCPTPGCGRSFATSHGLDVHQGRSHGRTG